MSSQLSPVEQGNILQAAANAEPPIAPQGLARILVIVVLVTATIATTVVGLRVYVRAWLGRRSGMWGWEDTAMVMGYLAFLTSSIFCVLASYYGLGTRDSALNPYLMVRCAEYMLYSQVTYGVSMPLIKAAVLLSLIRLTPSRRYHYLLWAMQSLATLMAFVGVLASLLYCRPVRAYWNPLLGKCGNFLMVVNIGYAWTAIGILTDWMCAIIPWFIIRKLQMGRRQKQTVMVILGLGAIASSATIVRAPYLQFYLSTVDRLYWNGYISLWCQLESGLGLIAASLPSLRQLFRKWLDDSRQRSGQRSHYTTPFSGASGSCSRNRNNWEEEGGPKIRADAKPMAIAMADLNAMGKAKRSEWERLADETISAKHIIQTRTVSVETATSSDDGIEKVEAHVRVSRAG